MTSTAPGFVFSLAEWLASLVVPTRSRVHGIDITFYAVNGSRDRMPEKALCVAPECPPGHVRSILDGLNRLPSPCVECVIIPGSESVRILDLANVRDVEISRQVFKESASEAIIQYLKTGHVVFLDPLFEDPEFFKRCHAVFRRSLDMLSHGTTAGRYHDRVVRIALQVVVDLCAGHWGARAGEVSIVDGLQPVEPDVLARVVASWKAIPDMETRLDERVICHLMEQSIINEEKRRTGAYYTPRAWAWYTCYEALEAFVRARTDGLDGKVLHTLKILDPAMGSGDFLDAVSLPLVDAWLMHLARACLPECINWNQLRLKAKVEHVFARNLHGIDSNPVAVDITRARLHLNALKHVSRDASLGSLMGHFTSNLVQDDFLTRTIPVRSYDIVIGNPPYLMEVRNNQAIFRHYSKHPHTRHRYEPKMDVFYFFMFKGSELLKDGGILGFVVQEYWLDRYHARSLRAFMFQEMTVVAMILFKRCKVFPAAPGQHTMIVVARRGVAPPDVPARICSVHETAIAGLPLLSELLARTGCHVSFREVLHNALYDSDKDKVFVNGEVERELFDRVHMMEYERIQGHEIQVGINIPQPFVRRAGRVEGVFVVSRDQAPRIAISPAEQSILKPFHKATDIDAYTFSTDEQLFIIYTTNENMKRLEADRETYANLRAHLDGFAGVITSDHRPYGLHRPRQPGWFEAREKIIGVRKTRFPRFAVVPQDYYMDQAALFIRVDPARRFSPHYACAFLNSHVAFRILSGIKTQGGQLQIDKNVLTRLPVPGCHELDHETISALSSWLHVFGIIDRTRKVPAWQALATSIRSIVDGFFERLVSHGGKGPLLAVIGIAGVPKIDVTDHLARRRCIEAMHHLEGTAVDVEALREAAIAMLPALEVAVNQLASRAGC